MSRHPSKLCMLLCLAIVTSACSSWLELPVPESSLTIPHLVLARHEQVPLLLDRVRITRNGSPQNPSAEIEERVLGTLRELGLFSRSISSGAAAGASPEFVVRARLSVDETLDPHTGATISKGMVIGASMFLLAPLLPLRYDYAAHATLELERWDGLVQRYEAYAKGTAHYQLFGASPLLIDELKGHVTESWLASLVWHMAYERDRYRRENGHLFADRERSPSQSTLEHGTVRGIYRERRFGSRIGLGSCDHVRSWSRLAIPYSLRRNEPILDDDGTGKCTRQPYQNHVEIP